MTTTHADVENDTDSGIASDDDDEGCDNDWCDGPESETLPCFECFDPDREYDLGVTSGCERSAEPDR